MLDGRDGGDTIDGGAGTDTVTYANSGAGVTIDLNVTSAQGGAGHGLGDVLANVENLTGSAHADVLGGTSGVNTILGGDGDDVIEGRGGADTLTAGNGIDTASYSSSSVGVTST